MATASDLPHGPSRPSAAFGRGEGRYVGAPMVSAARSLAAPEAWLVWALGTAFVVWVLTIQTGFAVISAPVQLTARLDTGQISLALAVYAWVFAICRFLAAPLLEHFGARPLLAVAVAVATAGAFLYAGVDGFGMLMAAEVVLAVGSSFAFAGVTHLAGDWFPAARVGGLTGLTLSLAALGGALSQPAVYWQLRHMTWQQLMYGYAAVGVLLIVLSALVVRSRAQGADPRRVPGATAKDPGRVLGSIGRELGRDLKECTGTSGVMIAALLGGVAFGALIAIGFLWGPRLMISRGADPALGILETGMAWLGFAVGAPLFNLLSARWGSRRIPAVIGVALQVCAAVLVIYLPVQTTGVSMVTMFAFGFFAGAGVLAYAIAAESVPEGRAGTSAAIVSAVAFVLAGLFLVLPGRLLPLLPGLDDFGSALLIVPVLLAVAAVAGLFLRDTAPRGPAGQGAAAGEPQGAGPAQEPPARVAPGSAAQDRPSATTPDPGHREPSAPRVSPGTGRPPTAGTPGTQDGTRGRWWRRRPGRPGPEGGPDKNT